MREPLDLDHARPQVCPLCHNRGSYPAENGYRTLCSCPVGETIKAADEVRERLSSVYSSRDATLWIESRIPALGGERPVQLLRDGRADEVMAVVDRIPGIRPREARVPEVLEVQPAYKPRELLPEEVDQARRVVLSKLQKAGYRKIADAFGQGYVADLDDREQAVLDAVLTGVGYLVGDKRVDPQDVEIIRWS